MSLSLDLQFAGMISGRVRNYKRTSNGLNFSCPYCGDSSNNKSKARGYLYRKPESLFYTCFNCNTPKHDMQSLLVVIDPNLAEQYRVEKFLEHKNSKPAPTPVVKKAVFADNIAPGLKKVSSLPAFHRVKKYVVERGIPSDKHYLLYYTPTWKQFAQSIDATTYEHFDPIRHEDEPRLVIPLIQKGGKIAGYQGRVLDNTDQVKYMTILTHEDNPKIFGIDRLDPNYKIRTFEGPLDALFIDNAIATCGSRIDSVLEGFDKDRVVIVYDNEPRKKETVKKIEQAIANGYKVCIWPQSISETDVNSMVLSGKAPSEISQIIDNNTFKGLQATLELKKWKRV